MGESGGTWGDPRYLSVAELEPGSFTGAGRRRVTIDGEDAGRLLAGKTIEVEDEVVRVDPTANA